MERADETNLRDLLARVHERLSQAGEVEPQTRRLLVALTRDIERALATGSAPRAPVPPPREAEVTADAGPNRAAAMRQSLASLEGLAARFDADHPALAQTLHQLIDLLGKAGI